MSFIPKPHEIYKHFKGNLYQIVTLAEHTETGECMVIYQAMYDDFKIYARPLELFVSPVDKVKYPDVTQKFRFELQGVVGDGHGRPDVSADATSDLDPLVLEFLDADSYEQRLNILAALHHRITDAMITTMAIACDVEVEDGDTEKRYDSLKNCLLTLEKYECNRLR